LAKPAIHPDILTPLLVMSLAFGALFLTLLILRIRMAFAERRIQAAEAVA
jgi:heme exporter protein C